MIPIKLEITNFLSYRATAVLDFNGIHLACIAGPNGAGKSGILDAITWALFGQSRARSDDDLINRSAAARGDAAEVRFTFELEGNCYRVIRRKQAGKSTLLELQMAAGAGSWKPLSESRLRETEAAIEQLLRMNYDAFTNASFLLQGKADEFTTKTPNRRKEILADLLGVTQWERYKESAAAQRKTAENEQALHGARLADIEQELAEADARAAALTAAQEQAARLAAERAVQEKLLAQMRQTEATLKQQKQIVQGMADNIGRVQRTLESWRRTQAERRQEREGYTAVLSQAAQITADFDAWQAAEQALQGWQDKAEMHNRLQQARQPHDLAIAQAHSRLEQEQQQLAEQVARIADADVERAQVAAAQAQAETDLTEHKGRMAQVAAQEGDWQAARTQLQQLSGARQLQQQELAQLQKQARQIQAMAAEKTAVRKNLAEARELAAALAAQIGAVAAQHQRHAVVLAELDTLESSQPPLRDQMLKIKDRLDRLEATDKESACPLCGQPLSAKHRTAVLGELKAEGQTLGDRFRENQARVKALQVEVKQLQSTLQHSSRLERDLQAQQQRQAQAEARLAEIEKGRQAWEADGGARLVELAGALADEAPLQALQAKTAALQTAVQAKAGLDAARQEAERRIANAAARLAEIDRLAETWQTRGQVRLAAVERALADQSYAPEAQTAVAAIAAQAAELGYDAAVHQAARAERDALAEAPARRQQLQQAQAAVQPLDNALAELAARIAEQESHLEDLRAQHTAAQQQLAALALDARALQAVEEAVFRLREAEIAATQRVGAARQRLDVLQDLRAQKKQLTQAQTAVAQQIQRLKLLEKACGRNGVQALIIEQALPEIEAHANELLERLTDGDMRVSFETQRQLKSRDALAETLDIHIADRDGERPYDNYSGGEQFRVNFAIRLALSQLLARRAGARLQTLVIDEGFGSQDPNGRQRLIEAINTIQNDFARILVITHIEELRDAFPTRVEVTKGAAGSTITVV